MEEKLDENQRYALDLSIEKGASSWLNTLPLKRYKFDLSKTEFRDGMALRYGWEPLKTPALCPCEESISVSRIPSNATKDGTLRCDTTKFRLRYERSLRC